MLALILLVVGVVALVIGMFFVTPDDDWAIGLIFGGLLLIFAALFVYLGAVATAAQTQGKAILESGHVQVVNGATQKEVWIFPVVKDGVVKQAFCYGEPFACYLGEPIPTPTTPAQ